MRDNDKDMSTTLPEGQFKVSTEWNDESYQTVYCNRCSDGKSVVKELSPGDDLVDVVAACVKHLTICEDVPGVFNEWNEYGYHKEEDE